MHGVGGGVKTDRIMATAQMQEEAALMNRAASGIVTVEDIEELRQRFGSESVRGASFPVDLALKAAQFGYFKWPSEIRRYFQGKRVLDVGCGNGTDSIGFITLGASEYVGIDQGLDLHGDVVKNKNGERVKGGMLPKTSFGWTPSAISAAIPQVSFFSGTFEELRAKTDFAKFDVIAMHTVTEHLLQIDDALAGCANLLKDDGRLIYLHHNFYCWNGHHMAPKRVADIDKNDPKQRNYLDWNHLLFDPPEGHYFRRALNRIRLDDLKALTEKYFEIEEWREKRDSFGRLTDDIRQRLPQYTERELTTNKVFCVAKPRARRL